MTVGEVVGMFLLIVGHNMRIGVVAYHFQHFTKTITWCLKEVRRVLCQLGKILIHHSNIVNEVSSYIFGNPKYFSYLKVRFYK